MFLDETWTATNMTRSHGRCAKGERLRMGFPHGHRKTTTLVAGLRMTGMVAPMVLASPEQWGPINGDRFEAYVRQVLVPDLKPGDIVIMDNLSSHKRTAARELIEEAGDPALPPALQPRLQCSPEQSRRTHREALLQGSPERGRRSHQTEVPSCSRRQWRSGSPVPGGSILTTSAPNSPSILAAKGPAMSWPISTTRRPFNAPGVKGKEGKASGMGCLCRGERCITRGESWYRRPKHRADLLD